LPLVVLGAHLSGEPLNPELTARGARLIGPVRTAPRYQMYALPADPPRPGVIRVAAGGQAIEGELWLLPPAGLGSFLATLPEPMSLGPVLLDDGTNVTGFLCQPHAVAGAEDISGYGSWRGYLRSSRPD
jgi:allophanate hydrolase